MYEPINSEFIRTTPEGLNVVLGTFVIKANSKLVKDYDFIYNLKFYDVKRLVLMITEKFDELLELYQKY